MVKKASDSLAPSQDPAELNASSGPQTEKLGTFASLDSANYRWFWVSGLAAGFTMQMRQMARGWLVFNIRQSPLALALAMASFGIPMTIFSPVGGALADRLPKRTIIFVSNLVNGLSSLLVGLLILWGDIALWHLFLIGLMDGILNAFNMPSRQGMIPSLVSRERLVNAVALSMGAMNVSRIAAPALAGVLIPWIGLKGVYFVMTFLNVLAAGTIMGITVSGTQQGDWREWKLGREVFKGLRYVATNRVLLSILLLAFAAVVLGMGFMILMPAFVVEALDGNAQTMGLLMAVSGVGAVAGSLALAYLGDPRRKGALLLGGILMWAVTVLIFSISRDIFLASAMLFLVGFATSVFMSMNMALMQLLSSPEMYGRVMSINMMTWGLMPLGIIPLSAVAEQVGTPNALTGAALLLLIVAVVFPLVNRTVRRLET